MKLSLVIATAAATQISIRNLYKLSSSGIAAGKECTPPAADGVNPCEANHTCNGAKLATGAEGTLSCKKDPPALVTSSKVALKAANPAKLTHSHQTKSRLVKHAPHQVLTESTHAKLTTPATVPNSLTVPKEPSHARRTHQRRLRLSLKEPLRLVKNAFHQLLMAQTHVKRTTPALVTSSKVALKEANPAKLTHSHQTKLRLVKPAPHQVLMESTHAKLTTLATVPNSLTVPKEPSPARRTHQRKPPLSLKEPLRLVKNAFHQLLMAQ